MDECHNIAEQILDKHGMEAHEIGLAANAGHRFSGSTASSIAPCFKAINSARIKCP
jgi:hypothetical protein